MSAYGRRMDGADVQKHEDFLDAICHGVRIHEYMYHADIRTQVTDWNNDTYTWICF